jgi:PKHD-type hydroxylase
MFAYDFWQWEGVIPKTECESVIERTFNSATPEPAGVVKSSDSSEIAKEIRQTDIVWSEDPDLYRLIAWYINSANAESGWHINATMLDKTQIGRYGVGGHYDWHMDTVPPVDGMHRKLSFTLQLSDPDTYEGGDLLIGMLKPVTVTKKQGSIIVFPSCLYHTVAPVTKGERFSAVNWMRGPQFR